MRRLSADEQALWDKVVASVRPLHSLVPAPPANAPPPRSSVAPRTAGQAPPPAAPPRAAPGPGATLDGSWDKRLGKGIVQPDVTVDLHGHNLDTAYALLDRRLQYALEDGHRVILLVTGKPPTDDRRPVGRGAIRAAVGDWLAASRHARHIAAIRNAHPRHGGSGALYIILRRPR